MKMTERNELSFRQGYYCAVANIMRSYGEEVIARDVLTSYGAINPRGIDKSDLKVILPLINEAIRLEELWKK